MNNTSPSVFQRSGRIRLPLTQSAGMIGNYIWIRLAAQLRSAIPIVLYLLAVQVLVLGTPVSDGFHVAAGVFMVIIGLAIFLEGLMLAVMPVGEMCGLSLPRRISTIGILAVVFILGLLATAAEPSIVVLQHLGESVTPWDAPLLFVLLGRYSFLLVIAIGAGVGSAFILGMLRLLLRWSVKPVLLISVVAVIGITVWARTEPNLALLCGLAWDAGAITTSDVTVPLMLALGVGISRMSGRKEDEASGFGSVALASLVPIITVLILGAALLPTVPEPMTRAEFVSGDRNTMISQLFGDRQAFDLWAADNLTPAELAAWAEEKQAVVPVSQVENAEESHSTGSVWPVFKDAAMVSVRAVIPLSLFLIFIVRVVLRRRLPWRDETLLGVAFCLIGMTIFTTGVEIGLKRLGEQSGKSLPSLFQAVDRPENAITLKSFDPSIVYESIGTDGSRNKYFLLESKSGPAQVPFLADRYDASSGTYLHIPRSEPHFQGSGGWIVLLLIAFGLGFTVTLVEPAVAALGVMMENVTIGVFPKQRIILIVSAGVGAGTLSGFGMIVWGIPLLWILIPLYFVILVLTMISSELFSGIAWDAGGATTASVTVPLVLAIGAGLGGKIGAAESFGILALASGFPILGVLVAGLSVKRGRMTASRRQQQ